MLIRGIHFETSKKIELERWSENEVFFLEILAIELFEFN